jgi:hypothetical protein
LLLGFLAGLKQASALSPELQAAVAIFSLVCLALVALLISVTDDPPKR